MEIIQTYGRKKTALAIAHCKRGRGSITINGCPLPILKPDILQSKIDEVIKLLVTTEPLDLKSRVAVDLRIFVHGGGQVSRVYAIRQAIAKAFVAFHGKFVDEESRIRIKDLIRSFDRTLLVSDPRRCEPKKFGGKGARAKYQKSYR